MSRPPVTEVFPKITDEIRQMCAKALRDDAQSFWQLANVVKRTGGHPEKMIEEGMAHVEEVVAGQLAIADWFWPEETKT